MNAILSIDPGTEQSAVVEWDGERILSAQIIPNHRVETAIVTSGVGIVVIERIESYGMAVGREVFQTCFWCGYFWRTARLAGKFIGLVPRREVKMHLCGQMKAKDGNIAQALKDRFGDKGTKANQGLTYNLKADLWQAFALAVTCFDLPDVVTRHAAPET